MKSRKYVLILFGLATVCTVIAFLFTAFFSAFERVPLISDYQPISDKSRWQVVSGSTQTDLLPGDQVSCIGDSLTLSRTVYPEKTGNNVLLFRNNRQCVTVRAEGEVLFLLGDGPRYYPFCTTGYISVPLPEKGRAYTLELSFTNLSGNICRVPEFFFSTLNSILIFLCMKDLPTFIFVPLWLVLGLFLAILTIVLIRKKQTDHRVFSLSLFLLLASAWNISDMYITPLFPINMEMNSTLSHYLLMFLPITVLYFIHWCSSCRPLRLRTALVTVLLGNVIIQTILMITNQASLHSMVFVSQGLLLLMMFYGLAASILDYRAVPRKTAVYQIAAFSISAFIGSMVILVYWLKPDIIGLYRVMFQFNITTFLLSMAGVIIVSLEERSAQQLMKDAELNAYRAISTEDPLTGLKNRRAFDMLMVEIENHPDHYPDAYLVFMDLNGLKYANDKFGHMAGDELIIAVSKCILAGFEPEGRTFRIGGDEFAAVLTGGSQDVECACRRMDASITAYNTSAAVPLSVARGFTSILSSDGTRLSVSDWKMLADKRMYEDKVTQQSIRTGGTAEDYLELISSFVSAVDAKDSYTADHSRRVGILTDQLCLMLGLSESSKNEIHIAACLHDIGKIGIPDSILSKPVKLSPYEWRIMQSHPVVGEEIIKHNRSFYDISQIIRHHHEHMDGSGYPDGISGDQIPLGSRIISIADSIDAMTSSRSYRDARSLEYCREEIRKNLGILYDGAIGQIVLEHWSEIETVVKSFH